MAMARPVRKGHQRPGWSLTPASADMSVRRMTTGGAAPTAVYAVLLRALLSNRRAAPSAERSVGCVGFTSDHKNATPRRLPRTPRPAPALHAWPSAVIATGITACTTTMRPCSRTFWSRPASDQATAPAAVEDRRDRRGRRVGHPRLGPLA